MAAACKVQLGSLCLASSASAAAALEDCVTGLAVFPAGVQQQQQLDLEQLLQQELAAALAEQQL
jgi:hypothetical protein